VFQAVEENSVSILQLAKNAYSENQLLASLVQYNKKGETPLVIAMKGKNVSVISELVTVLQKCDYKIYKFHLMFVIDQLSHDFPILEIIDWILKDNYSYRWLKFIAKVFIKSPSFTREDKIIALELLGAVLVSTASYHSYKKMLKFGLVYWKKSMTLRYFPQDGELILPKTPAVCVPSEASSVVFGSDVEVITMEEIDFLQEEFENHSLFVYHAQIQCMKRWQIQALLVILRISSQAHHGHLHWLYLECLFSFTEFVFARMRESKIVLNSYLLVLEQMNGFDPKQISRQSFEIFIKTLGRLANHFRKASKGPPDSPARKELTYENLLVPTEFIAKILKLFPESAMISSIKIMGHRFALFVYNFLLVFNSISPQMTNEEKQKLEEYYSSYIRQLFTERTATVLNVALTFYSFYQGKHLYLDTLKQILQLGADPNAIDEKGRSPLHILADKQTYCMDEYEPMFQILLDAGSHLDMATDDGDTVVSIMKTNAIECQRLGLVVHPYYKSLINTVFPLTCYAARVIRRHGIPFDEDRLPSTLQEFVSRHSDKGIKTLYKVIISLHLIFFFFLEIHLDSTDSLRSRNWDWD
jgi:hypothetical protein